MQILPVKKFDLPSFGADCPTWLYARSPTKPTIRINWQSYERRSLRECARQIYDASGKPWGKQVLTLRGIKMTAREMRETAGKLLQYVDVENPGNRTARSDYYLANTKGLPREHLPEKKKLIPMATACRSAYQAGQWIVRPQNSAIQMMRKIIYLYSQMNAVENFADGITWRIICCGQSQTFRIAITTSWDRKVLTPFSFSIIGTYRPSRRGLQQKRLRTVKKGYAQWSGRYPLFGERKCPSRKTQWKRNSPQIKMATWRKWSMFRAAKRRKPQASRLIDFQEGVEDSPSLRL